MGTFKKQAGIWLLASALIALLMAIACLAVFLDSAEGKFLIYEVACLIYIFIAYRSYLFLSK
jgi:hypothetical protein